MNISNPILLQDIKELDGTKPHWHCDKCWSEDYMFLNFTMVCKKCYQDNEEYRKMILCTPFVCASS